MEPLEIKVPLKIDETQLIKLEIEDAPIKLKVKDNSNLIRLKISDQDKVNLKVEKEKPIKLKVNEGTGGGGGTYPEYEGPFVITPKPYDDIVLNTTQKTVMDNITVLKIPHYETSNLKGKTFIIGG